MNPAVRNRKVLNPQVCLLHLVRLRRARVRQAHLQALHRRPRVHPVRRALLVAFLRRLQVQGLRVAQHLNHQFLLQAAETLRQAQPRPNPEVSPALRLVIQEIQHNPQMPHSHNLLVDFLEQILDPLVMAIQIRMGNEMALLEI